MEARDFFRLLEQHPVLVRGLLSGLSLRIGELTRRLTELSGGRVDTRFARLFLKLAEQMGARSRAASSCPCRCARQELADLTGTTIETCIRIMSRWEKDNVVHTGKDGFVILDRDEIEAVAGA